MKKFIITTIITTMLIAYSILILFLVILACLEKREKDKRYDEMEIQLIILKAKDEERAFWIKHIKENQNVEHSKTEAH